MHELRACDFCGADAVGTFEVVPPELDPTEAEQRRVVLCSTCRGTLETVLEPFFARLGGERSEPKTDETELAVDTTTPVDDPASGEIADEDEDEGEESEATTDPLGDGVTFASDPKRAPDDADELHAESPSESGDSDYEAQRDQRSEAEGDETGFDATTTAESATDTSATSKPGPDAAATPGPEPDEFRTVMRLLANREFPIERADVESLATHAYDLEPEQVDTILDYAVDRGILDADGDQLRRD